MWPSYITPKAAYFNWIKCLTLKVTSLEIFCCSHIYTHIYGWKHVLKYPHIQQCGGWRGSLTLRCPGARHLGSRCRSVCVCVCCNSTWKPQGLALAEWNTSNPPSSLCSLPQSIFSLYLYVSLLVVPYNVGLQGILFVCIFYSFFWMRFFTFVVIFLWIFTVFSGLLALVYPLP